MFVQVGEHRDHAQGGLGIGLSLVRTLVEMHGGSIAARSEGPGTGSEFVVRLPVLAAAPEAEAPRPGPSPGARPSRPPRRRILVVDDNVDAAKSLARLLARLYGQEVRVAHDGPEALAVAEEFRPEVVLLDIGLPGMDGNEVARRLRERPEFDGTLLVALTGWGQEADLAAVQGGRASTTTWSSRRTRTPSSDCSRRTGRSRDEPGAGRPMTPDDGQANRPLRRGPRPEERRHRRRDHRGLTAKTFTLAA